MEKIGKMAGFGEIIGVFGVRGRNWTSEALNSSPEGKILRPVLEIGRPVGKIERPGHEIERPVGEILRPEPEIERPKAAIRRPKTKIQN